MNKNIKWYLVIFISIGFLIYFLIGMNGEATDILENDNLDIESESYERNKLPIPEILENKSKEKGKAEFDLKVNNGEKEFIEGYKAKTLGYNGDYLGPVIKVNKGDDVRINIENNLREETTVHWHGLEVPGEMDGGPHQIIEGGDTWRPHFTINQDASTLWYHPHMLGKTGEQVYKGLAGLFYIEDEISKNLDIPKDYGVNDIPIIVQDKRFTSEGEIPYNLDMMDLMEGFRGDTILVNGEIYPDLDVKSEMIRLRLLNGSNSRNYLFNFSENNTFYQIASDGGFLEKPVKLQELYLAPGERAEILIDLSYLKDGESINLKDGNLDLLKINVTEEGKTKYDIPKTLREIEKYKIEDVKKTRLFEMSGAGRDVNINGKQMDMDRIDEEVNLNELEEWVITNETMYGNRMGIQGRQGRQGRHHRDNQFNPGMRMMHSMAHPFHIHSVQFQIIERDGNPPPLNERGWKDTVMVQTGEEVRVLAKFKDKGLFMYHCHILEHEDLGMMGQFLVK